MTEANSVDSQSAKDNAVKATNNYFQVTDLFKRMTDKGQEFYIATVKADTKYYGANVSVETTNANLHRFSLPENFNEQAMSCLATAN